MNDDIKFALVMGVLIGVAVHGVLLALNQPTVRYPRVEKWEPNISIAYNNSKDSFEGTRYTESWDERNLEMFKDRKCFIFSGSCVVDGRYNRWWEHLFFRPPWGLISLILLTLAAVTYVFQREKQKQR